MKECAVNFGGGYFQALTDNRQKLDPLNLNLGRGRVTWLARFDLLSYRDSSSCAPLVGKPCRGPSEFSGDNLVDACL